MASRHAPVRHTCPDIDKCIKWIKDAMSSINSAMNHLDNIDDSYDVDNPNGIPDSVRLAKDELRYAIGMIDFDGVLEELRSSNSELRDWGHDLVAEIEKLESKLD